MAVYGTLTIVVSIDADSVEEAENQLHELTIADIQTLCEKDNGKIVKLDYHDHKLVWEGKAVV